MYCQESGCTLNRSHAQVLIVAHHPCSEGVSRFSVEDAWGLEEGGGGGLSINTWAAQSSADEVLARHAASRRQLSDPAGVMVNVHETPSRHCEVNAMQRLAMQKGT